MSTTEMAQYMLVVDYGDGVSEEYYPDGPALSARIASLASNPACAGWKRFRFDVRKGDYRYCGGSEGTLFTSSIG